MNKKFSDWSKEDLINELIKLTKIIKEKESYGLVWEQKKEDATTQFKNKVPILNEIKQKEILTNKNEPFNTIIEGDNFNALSILNYTHKELVDIIYIDPPYNTGKPKEWKFNDKWVDENDLFKPSKWLSMMSNRLKISKELLSEQGVIFISIDDNEYANLKLLMDKIFSKKNYVGTLIWEKKKKGSHLDKFIINIKEYILVYKKSENFNGLVGVTTSEETTYPCLNPGNGFSNRLIPKGTISNYKDKNFTLKKGKIISAGNMRLTLKSNLIVTNGYISEDVLIEAEWRLSQEKIDLYSKNKTLYLTRDLYFRRRVNEERNKKLKDLLLRLQPEQLSNLKDELILAYQKKSSDKEIENLIEKIDLEKNKINLDYLNDGWGSNEDADDEQREFFGKKVFDFPKPSKLIKKLILSTRIKNPLVLDFFAGTGTTGHAALELNSEGYINSFILCNNNEDNTSDGLKITSDICYPRIKKVIFGYQKRNKKNVKGTQGNLKYFKTNLINYEKTDQHKYLLSEKITDIICFKEQTYKKVKSTQSLIIYENQKKIVIIILDPKEIDYIKNFLKNKKEKLIKIYIFSYGAYDYQEEFEEIENINIIPIPSSLTNEYEKLHQEL